MNGDIVVAGYGAGTLPNPQYRGIPMLARVDRAGNVVWQRTFEEFAEDAVLGLLSDERGDFVLLSRVSYEGEGARRAATAYRQLYLRRIGAKGDLSEVVTDIRVACLSEGSGGSVGPFEYSEQGKAGLVVVATEDLGVPSRSVCEGFHQTIFVLYSDGSVEMTTRPGGYWPTQYLGSGQWIMVRIEPEGGYTIARSDSAGAWASQFRLPNGTTFGTNDIIATPQALFFLRDYYARGTRQSSVVTYSPTGALIAEHETGLPFLVRRPVATPEGGALVVGIDNARANGLVMEFGFDGAMLWSSAIKARQGVGDVYSAIVLRDGWVAVTGLTGPLSWETMMYRPHVKREAFVLVAERTPDSFALANQVD